MQYSFPEDWEVVKLEDLKIIVTSGSRGWAKFYQKEGDVFVRISNLSRDSIKIDLTDKIFVLLPHENNEGKRTRLKHGDILISITADLGRIGYWDFSKENGYVNQHIALLRIEDKRVERKFVAYLFSSRHYQKFFFDLDDRGAKSGLSLQSLRKLPLLIPPLPEQQKIAAILSTWDKAIELAQSLIDAKEEQKKGLMQRLLTGKVRFRKFIRSEETFHSKFGKYPKDWAFPKIKEVAKEVSVKNENGEELPVLSSTKHRGLVDSLEYFGKKIYSEDTSTYKVVSKGQFAYATNHIEEGSIGYQDLYEKALISPMYTAFEANKDVNDFFLFKLLKTPLFIHIYQANTSASVDRRGSLRWGAFSHIHIPLPSIEEQNKIAEVIKESEREITLLKNHLEALKHQKKGLMQQLLTGKTRVKV